MNCENDKLVQKSCVEFDQALASKAPVPGGGGAAALAGALSAALCSMVCNYTIGKKKYAAYEEEVKDVLNRADALRVKLEELVDQDAQAFEPLSKAYSIPADQPDRDEILEKASLDACAAPCEMVRCCAQVIDLLSIMNEKGSVLMISDVGCGAALCHAAMKAASMNVYINTKSMKDKQTAVKIENEIDALLDKYLPIAQSIADSVAKKIRKER